MEALPLELVYQSEGKFRSQDLDLMFIVELSCKLLFAAQVVGFRQLEVPDFVYSHQWTEVVRCVDFVSKITQQVLCFHIEEL